jgi:hypothetical protein
MTLGSVVCDPVRDNPHRFAPPHRPGRALIGASGACLRKSFRFEMHAHACCADCPEGFELLPDFAKNLFNHLAGIPRSPVNLAAGVQKMLLKSNPPFALWSIWRYLPFAQKLFLLILCVVGVYSLVSAIVVMARLRAMTIVPQKEDISSIQRAMAALHKRCTNIHQLIRATFYLFGFVLFLGLQGAYFVLGLSSIPIVFLVFLILHLVQWFVSGRVCAYDLHSNTYHVA